MPHAKHTNSLGVFVMISLYLGEVNTAWREMLPEIRAEELKKKSEIALQIWIAYLYMH